MDSGAFNHSNSGRSPLFPAHSANAGLGMNYFGSSMPEDDTMNNSLDDNLNGGLGTSLDFGFPTTMNDEHHKFDLPDNNSSREPTFPHHTPKQPTKWTNQIEEHVKELRHQVRLLSRAHGQPRPDFGLLKSQFTVLQSQHSALSDRQAEVQRQCETLRRDYERLQHRHNQTIVQLQAVQPMLEKLDSLQHHVTSVLAESKTQESVLLSCFSGLDQTVRSLEAQQSELSRRVDAHESDNVDTGDRLQEFFEHATGGLDSIARFIHQQFPSAPPFREVEALIALEGEDEQQA